MTTEIRINLTKICKEYHHPHKNECICEGLALQVTQIKTLRAGPTFSVLIKKKTLVRDGLFVVNKGGWLNISTEGGIFPLS